MEMNVAITSHYQWSNAQFINTVKEVTDDMVPEEQQDWLCKVGRELLTWDQGQDYIIMRQAEILYMVNSVWDRLSLTSTLLWNNDFYRWAEAFTRKRSKTPARITIANKISVFKDWVAEKAFYMPELVLLPKLDEESGVLVDDTLISEDGWIEVPFDPMQCDYGKLLVARAAARNNEMTESAWTALQDSTSTVADLKSALNQEQERPRKKDSLRIWTSNGIFYVTENERTVVFASIDLENQEDPLASKALRYLMKVLGIDDPIGVIEPNDVLIQEDLAVFDGRTLKINFGGSRIVTFDRLQAKKIADTILDSLECDF